ncbi:glycosyltransferase family 2 protein [Cognatishimia activa]|uniref:Cellulose synthase catalytic subunit [UDP-forming] n=1 Tax=Cognatishimia activa TaxID=1715691 RepID=A0A0P1IQ01_9RHOB|nr:glycosyltransferase family 2 protein [Cognatishimia activa]CUI88637.1 Cellulose synthase catalytic subunit [UDP-forming] [Cognatishimia activa]CUK25647.1 Cellulose synthase catalytic subunit [UDP-forming] [Cognatishimia activa]
MLQAAEQFFAQPTDIAPDRQLSLGRRLLEDGLIAPWQLFYGLSALTKWDACLADVLIAKSWVSEARLMPYLSDHYAAQVIDLKQAPPDFRLSQLLPASFCIKHAIVPWISTNGQLVFATSRPHAFETLKPALPAGPNGLRFVLVNERDLHEHLAKVFHHDLVHLCETRVPSEKSCRDWTGGENRRYKIIATLLAMMVTIFAAFPIETLLFIAVIILFTQAMAANMKASAFFKSRPAKVVRPKTHGKLPKISVLVPLYKETEIARALIRRLGALTYPKALLDVVLVLEEDDTQTKAALDKGRLTDWMRVVQVPPGSGLTTKPRAMNYALDFCKGDVIGIWDAEDAPAPDQLEIVAAHVLSADGDVACWQGILDYYNPKTNWLSRCFALEYSMWFRTILRGMSRLGAAIPLGGTTLFLRRDAIEAVGGWDAHNVTEDADLGIRLYRHGYRTELISTVTQEEANCRFQPWVKQRSRWLKGYMITYLVHMRRPRLLLQELGLRGFLGFNAIFLSTLSQFLLAPFVWSFWLIALGAPISWLTILPNTLILLVTALFIGCAALDMTLAVTSLKGQNRRWLAGWAATLPFYFTLATVAAYKALFELVSMPFYWDKTAHGQTPEGLQAEYSALSP